MPKSKGTKRSRKEFEKLSDAELPYQTRCWDFTLNNYTEEEVLHIQTVAEYRFCGYGKEIAPTTGTPHLQGMVIFANGKTRKGVIAVLGPRISCRQMYSSEEALLDYVEKGGDWWEKGERPVSQAENGESSKQRTINILGLAKEGKFDELEERYPEAWFYQQRAIMSARGHTIKNNVCLDGVLENYWIFGKSGVGKGLYVDSMSTAYYTKAADEKWWCGYNGENDVLMDDLGKGIIPLLGKFKLWTDRKPFNAEVKGGNWLIRPTRVFVTSHWHPSEIVTDPDDLEAILRRFQVVEIVDGQAQWHERERIEKPPVPVKVMVTGKWVRKPPAP